MWVIFRGIDTIRFLLNIKAPLLIVLGLLLLWWAWRKAGGFGPMLSQPSAFDAGQPKAGQFWTYFFPALTGMIGFWATLSLNIPDFSRYAKSQRDQVIGQALGLPATMALYSFIGVAVTSATTIIFGETLWNPVDVLTRFDSHTVLITAMISLCIATLATNIAANVVSPANDFAHLAPRHFVPDRRLHHRHHWRADDAMETVSDPTDTSSRGSSPTARCLGRLAEFSSRIISSGGGASLTSWNFTNQMANIVSRTDSALWHWWRWFWARCRVCRDFSSK
jgi:hypothetical protein